MWNTLFVGTVLAVGAATGLAGCAPRAASPPVGPAAQTQVVRLVMRDFGFEPNVVRVKADGVQFELVNEGAVEHDFAIPALAGHGAAQHKQHLVRPGQTGTVELDLPVGTYEAVCTVPGHKEAGMRMQVEAPP
ncbi:MAG: cupredoxin domain-containing protein [Armatimonadota bacterium]|nr:cupredoxin domain-containing protein [Armatimonadota bacterium]